MSDKQAIVRCKRSSGLEAKLLGYQPSNPGISGFEPRYSSKIDPALYHLKLYHQELLESDN